MFRKDIDGFFDFYPTRSVEHLESRLSEMFHLGRAGYILSAELSKHIEPLLDGVDASAKEREIIDTVLNEGGILQGYALGHLRNEEQLEFWLSKTDSALSD